MPPSIPRLPASHPLSRSRDRQEPGVPDQPSADHLRPVPVPMAGGAVLQVDQAALCASNASTALPRTLCGRKSGSPSSVYVLVAIIKKKLRLNVSLHTLLQILSLTLFEKLPLKQAVAGVEPIETNPAFHRQLNLFKF